MKEKTKWQPIETLPPFARALVTNVDRREIAVNVVSIFHNSSVAGCTEATVRAGLLTGWGRRRDMPTHWIPCPEPPA